MPTRSSRFSIFCASDNDRPVFRIVWTIQLCLLAEKDYNIQRKREKTIILHTCRSVRGIPFYGITVVFQYDVHVVTARHAVQLLVLREVPKFVLVEKSGWKIWILRGIAVL